MPQQKLMRPSSSGPPICLEYEIHGDPAAQPVVLLICGLGAQMTEWPLGVRFAPSRA
jgi:hypothetical protein